jgi:hypothetical protein
MFIFSRAEKARIIRREIFYFLSCLLLIFIIMEIIFPRIILAYFNLNYLFILVFFSGLFVLVKDGK